MDRPGEGVPHLRFVTNTGSDRVGSVGLVLDIAARATAELERARRRSFAIASLKRGPRILA